MFLRTFGLPMILCLVTSLASANPVPKTEYLKFLETVLNQYEEKIRNADQRIVDLIEDSAKIKDSKDPFYENLHSRLKEETRARHETAKRMSFIERLRGQVSELYEGQDLKSFLQARISAMSRTAFGVNLGVVEPDESFGAWLVDLKIALGQSTAEGIDLLQFLTGAAENLPFHSLKNPIGIVESAQYTNGDRWETVQDREELETKVSQASRVPVMKQTIRVQDLLPTPPKPVTPVEPSESAGEAYE